MDCPVCGGETERVKTKEHIHLGSTDYYYTIKCVECNWCISVMNSDVRIDDYTIIDQEYDFLAGTGSTCLETSYLETTYGENKNKGE